MNYDIVGNGEDGRPMYSSNSVGEYGAKKRIRWRSGNKLDARGVIISLREAGRAGHRLLASANNLKSQYYRQ
jgi:hypothetical protein